VQLAGMPIRDEDVFTLASLLRTGGFEDVADKLTKALLLETKILALTVVDRESMRTRARSSSCQVRRRPRGSPDELDDETKNALAIRNACATSGHCPDCGAVGELEPDATLELVWHLTFRHEPDCRALTDGAAA
jgi:hypothetical protein